ncbi:hypothetical protein CJ666_22270 [Salmonella enterica]|nr:hypothetical protein [Salmonella enterica]
MKKTLLSVAISSLVVATSANAALNSTDAAAVHQYLSQFHNVPAYVYGALTDNANTLTDVNYRLKQNTYWDGSKVVSLEGTVHSNAQNTLAQGHNNPEGIVVPPAPTVAPVVAPFQEAPKAPTFKPAAVPTVETKAPNAPVIPSHKTGAEKNINVPAPQPQAGAVFIQTGSAESSHSVIVDNEFKPVVTNGNQGAHIGAVINPTFESKVQHEIDTINAAQHLAALKDPNNLGAGKGNTQAHATAPESASRLKQQVRGTKALTDGFNREGANRARTENQKPDGYTYDLKTTAVPAGQSGLPDNVVINPQTDNDSHTTTVEKGIIAPPMVKYAPDAVAPVKNKTPDATPPAIPQPLYTVIESPVAPKTPANPVKTQLQIAPVKPGSVQTAAQVVEHSAQDFGTTVITNNGFKPVVTNGNQGAHIGAVINPVFESKLTPASHTETVTKPAIVSVVSGANTAAKNSAQDFGTTIITKNDFKPVVTNGKQGAHIGAVINPTFESKLTPASHTEIVNKPAIVSVVSGANTEAQNSAQDFGTTIITKNDFKPVVTNGNQGAHIGAVINPVNESKLTAEIVENSKLAATTQTHGATHDRGNRTPGDSVRTAGSQPVAGATNLDISASTGINKDTADALYKKLDADIYKNDHAQDIQRQQLINRNILGKNKAQDQSIANLKTGVSESITYTDQAVDVAETYADKVANDAVDTSADYTDAAVAQETKDRLATEKLVKQNIQHLGNVSSANTKAITTVETNAADYTDKSVSAALDHADKVLDTSVQYTDDAVKAEATHTSKLLAAKADQKSVDAAQDAAVAYTDQAVDGANTYTDQVVEQSYTYTDQVAATKADKADVDANTKAVATNKVAISTMTTSVQKNTAGVAANRRDIDATSKQVNSNTRTLANHEGRITALEGRANQQFANIDKRLDENRNQANAGTSAALAASQIPQVSAGRDFSMGAGVGTYGNQQAVAVGFSARINDRVVTKFAVTGDSQQNFGAGAGASIEW